MRNLHEAGERVSRIVGLKEKEREEEEGKFLVRRGNRKLGP